MTIKLAENGDLNLGKPFILQVITPDVLPGMTLPYVDEAKLNTSGDFLVGLYPEPRSESPDSPNISMYRQGFEWGINDLKRFNRKIRQDLGDAFQDAWQENRKYLLENCWWPLTTESWGGWTAKFDFDNHGIVIVTLKNPEAKKTMEMNGKPTCPMYAGMFAGVFTVIEREERGAIQTQCYSMGGDFCQFLIAPPRMVNAVEFWRREGANLNEILANLKS